MKIFHDVYERIWRIYIYVYTYGWNTERREEGETRAYGTRFSIRSINSTHRNQGGEGREEGALEFKGGTRKQPTNTGDIGSRLERIRGEIEKFTPDSRAGFYRAQDGRKNGKKGKLSAAT